MNKKKQTRKKIEYEIVLTAAFDSRTNVDIVYDSQTRGAHWHTNNAFALIYSTALPMHIKFR